MDVAQLRVVVGADISDATQKLDTLHTKVGGFAESIKQGLGMGAGLAVFQTGLAALGGSFDAVKGAIIGYNQNIDSARASMSKWFDSTQSLNNSLASLQQLANKTPFQFPELVTTQQRTIAAARSSDELRQNIDAIAVAAANTGRAGAQNFDKISLALGQITTKGKVMGEEIMQLNEAGMNATQILADHFGVSTGQIQKMVTDGKVSSQDMFAALRQYAADPANRQALDGLSKTFEGAMSTIQDVMQSTMAGAFRPFFDLLTEGANTVANFLQSTEFQAFAEAVHIGMTGASEAVRGLLERLAPLGDLIATVVRQFAAGDFGGAFATIGSAVTQALTQAAQAVQTFAGQFFGAGSDLIGQFASGILQGGQSVLQGAIDTVAQMVASYFVGNSPPPNGPLSTIDQGGLNTAKAWVGGFATGLDEMKGVAESAAGNITAMKAAGESVEDALRGVNAQMRELDSQASAIKFAMDDIKDAAHAQLQPIQDQIDAIKERVDYERESKELSTSLEELDLRRARLLAEGDPIRRAQLAAQMQQLQTAKDELSNQFRLDDLRKKAGGDARSDAEERLQKLKDEAALARTKGASHESQQRRQREILKLEQDVRAERASGQRDQAGRSLQLAEYEQKILTLKKEQTGLVDKGELARVQAAQDALKVRKDEATYDKERLALEQKIALLPLEQQARAIKDAQREQLDPLQKQLGAIQRQKAELGEIKGQWQAIKDSISDAVGDMTRANQEAKNAGKDNAGPPGKRSPLKFDLDATTQEEVDAVKKRGQKMAENMAKGFGDWISEHLISVTLGSIGAALGALSGGGAAGAALGSIFGPIGTIFGGLLGAAIGGAVGAWLGGSLGVLIEERLNALGIDWGTITAGFDQMRQRFVSGDIGGLITEIGQRLAAALPLLAARLADWGKLMIDLFKSAIPPMLAQLTNVINAVLAWVRTNAGPLATQLYQWGIALVQWAQTALPKLLDALADIARYVLGWVGDTVPTLTAALLEWATEFVKWVGPKIPELLEELGTLVVKIVEWMADHNRELIESIGQWALGFVQWVAPKIPPLLAELKNLLESLTNWAIDVALPAITKKLGEWGLAFIQWVGTSALPGLAGALQTLWDGDGTHPGIGGWIGDTASALASAALALGSSLLWGTDGEGGIKGGIKGGLDGFWSWLRDNFVDKIPSFIKDILGIHSPSSVLYDIGVNLVEGLRLGMLRKLPSIDDLVMRVATTVGRVGGDVDDWLRAAMMITKTPQNWLGGLKKLVQFESGGDPRAVNPEAVNGQHATGLLQTMPSTFRAYAVDGLDDIFNPIHNAAAAINYIKDRYGSVYDTPLFDDDSPYKGYATGGIAWEPQLARVAEKEPEAIIPLSRLLNGGGPVQQLHLPVIIGGRTIEDIYVEGRELAIRRGRVPLGVGA